MSAALLEDPSAPHGIEDDRESSFYVLLWTALRYSQHSSHSESKTSPPKDVVRFLRGFDEAYAELSGDIRGGDIKQTILLGKRLSKTVQFYRRPKLDELLNALQKAFRIRYQEPPEDEDLEQFERSRAQGVDEATLALTLPSRYFRGLEKLQERGWLVDTMRTFLDNDGWPEADKAEPQGILPQTTSKRKLMQDHVSLHERVSKKRQVASAPVAR